MKRTTLKYQREDGENTKTKELNKKVQTIESIMDGESTGKKEKTTETLKLTEAKPDGRVRETVETKEEEWEELYEDDEGSLINSMINENIDQGGINSIMEGPKQNMNKKEETSVMNQHKGQYSKSGMKSQHEISSAT